MHRHESFILFLDKIWKLDISHAFLPLIIAKLSTPQKSFFGPPCMHTKLVEWLQKYRTKHFLPRNSYAKRGICRRRVSGVG